jgi:hypothetical protein
MSASCEGSLFETAALAEHILDNALRRVSDRPDRRSHSQHRGWHVVLLMLRVADVVGLTAAFNVTQRLFGLAPLLLLRASPLLKRVRLHPDCLYARRWSRVDAFRPTWNTVP